MSRLTLRPAAVALALVLVGGLSVLVAAPATACPSGSTAVTQGGSGTVCVAAVDPAPAPVNSPKDGLTHEKTLGVQAPPPPEVVGVAATVCPGVYVNGVCPTRPAGVVPPVLSPRVLAAKALGLLQLGTAQVHTAPSYPDREIVGAEVWMWVPGDQWRTLTKSVSAGGTTVTVHARPDYVAWRMGEKAHAGDVVDAVKRCYTPGLVWRRGMTDAATTPCGYTYRTTSQDEPGGLFHPAAAITYSVDWTCTGACPEQSGTLGEVDGPQGRTRLESVQRQTVVTQ